MSSYSRLSDLPLEIRACHLEPLQREVASGFVRPTTVVRLSGGGHEGVGEDVTWMSEDHEGFRNSGVELCPTGRMTLDGFSHALERVDLFPGKRPSDPVYRLYRRWALESAALDLALRQAGISLGAALGRRSRPIRFVVSMGLGSPPSFDRVARWLEADPDLEFKLDPSAEWDGELLRRLAATRAVRVVDFKGAYHGTPVDQPPDATLYRRVAEALPDAWLEDPALTPATREALADHRLRITWDAVIHSVEEIEALEAVPRMLNIKPSRFGSVRALLDAYDHCAAAGISTYGGGQFELGPGRGQIQLLAALFSPGAPNDVAPHDYNVGEPRPGLERSPLEPRPDATGFRRR